MTEKDLQSRYGQHIGSTVYAISFNLKKNTDLDFIAYTVAKLANNYPENEVTQILESFGKRYD